MKKFALKVAAWLLLSLLLHVGITFALAPVERHELLRPRQAVRLDYLLERLNEGAEVLSLVASIDTFLDPADTDRRYISTMLEEKLAPERVVAFTDAAFHMGVFSAVAGRPLAAVGHFGCAERLLL